jgi:hypothetical protein
MQQLHKLWRGEGRANGNTSRPEVFASGGKGKQNNECRKGLRPEFLAYRECIRNLQKGVGTRLKTFVTGTKLQGTRKNLGEC